jgi:hypothetical protein
LFNIAVVEDFYFKSHTFHPAPDRGSNLKSIKPIDTWSIDRYAAEFFLPAPPARVSIEAKPFCDALICDGEVTLWVKCCGAGQARRRSLSAVDPIATTLLQRRE